MTRRTWWVATLLFGLLLAMGMGQGSPVEAGVLRKLRQRSWRRPCRSTVQACRSPCRADEPQIAVDKNWGDLTLRFTYAGKPPKPKRAPTFGIELPFPAPLGDSLVVGACGELANVLVYLRPARDQAVKIHPDYAVLADKPVRLTIKGGMFRPHVLTVWNKRRLKIVNADPLQHTARITFFANDRINVLIPSKGSYFVQLSATEILPVFIHCNIHPWMKACLLIRDNPYAAVSSKDGTLTIKNLPVGEWEFQLWHEKWGYLSQVEWNGKPTAWYRGRPTFTIKPGENDFGTVKVDPKVYER